MSKKQRQAQKWSSRKKKPQNSRIGKKTTNEKAKKNSTLPLIFSMKALPLR
jgi:hypothetical protein